MQGRDSYQSQAKFIDMQGRDSYQSQAKFLDVQGRDSYQSQAKLMEVQGQRHTSRKLSVLYRTVASYKGFL